MAGQTVVHTLRVQSEERGGAQATAALAKVAGQAQAANAGLEKYAAQGQKAFAGVAASMTKQSDQLSRAMLNTSKSIDSLQRAVDPVYRTMTQFESAQRKVTAAIDAGTISAERGASIVAGYRDRYEKASASMGAMARAAANLNTVMDRVNSATGVSALSDYADRAADITDYGKQLDALRAKYNPLFAAQQRYLENLAEIRAAEKAGAFGVGAAGSQEAAEAVQRLDRAYLAQTASLKGVKVEAERAAKGVAAVGAAARLTSNQMLNLSRQGNDTLTMLAMGAPVSQVFASQIGQIYGALEEGPGGLRGSLKAAGNGIMSFARGAASALGPGGMVIAGVSAATAAAIYFTDKTEANLKKIDKAAKSYAETLKVIERSQRGLGASISSVIDEAQRRNPAELAVTSAREIQTQREALRAARQNALNIDPVDVDMLPNVITDFRNLFREIGGAVAASDIDALGRDFYEASRPIADIRNDLEQILTGEGLPAYLRDAADNMLSLVNSGDEALATIKGLEEGAQRLRETMRTDQLSQSVNRLDGFVPDRVTAADRINNEAANATELARSYGAVLEIERKRGLAIEELGRAAKESAAIIQDSLNNLDLSPGQRKIAEITQEYDRQIAEYRRTTNDPAGLAAKEAEKVDAVTIATTELARAEEARRAGHALDIQAIGARDAATKASIEAERTRIDLLSQGYGAAEAQARASETLSLSLAQSAQAEADSLRQRNEARTDALAGLQLEMQTLGQTAGETARLTTEYQLLQEAKRAAYDEGRNVGQEEIDAIQRQATAVGELTQALAEQQLQQDILFERSQIGLSDQEQAIRERLKSSGVDIESANGLAYASQIRYNDALQESRDLAKDFTETLVDGLSSGEGVLKSLTSAFAQLGQQMASKGLNMLFDGMMGGGGQQQSSAPTLGNAIGAIGQALSRPTASQTFSAPTIAVERGGALPPVVTGANFNSSKAATVAGQSVPVQMWNFFAGKGLASHQIAGILGNAKAESAFNPAAIGDAGAASGLFQWNDRGPAMQSFVGSDWRSDVKGQLDFAWKELQSSESKAYNALLKATNVTQATEAFLGFERPSGYNTGVRNSHNYSGRVENANAIHASMAGNDNVLTRSGMASSVSDGLANYSQKAASGAIPGVDPWGGLRQATGGQQATSSGGGGAMLGASSFLQSPLVQGGLNALSAGMAGYQSASPVGGALNGALSGFAMGGPVGAVIGGIAGLVGGIFGKKSAKKKAAQEADIAAGKAWEQAFPKLLELSDYVDMEEKGSLSQELADIETQLVEFRKLAAEQGKAKGHTAAINNVATVTAQAKTYGDRLKSEMRESAGFRSEDLAGGLGLDTEYEKARKGIKDTTKAYQGYIADVKLAFAVPDDQRGAINAAYEKTKNAVAAAEKVRKATENAAKNGEFYVILAVTRCLRLVLRNSWRGPFLDLRLLN
jgi:hypothetical protein